MTKKEWHTISTIVNTKQKEDLKEWCTECGMTESEYIKARVYIDQDGISKLHTGKLRKFDKDIASAITRSYCLIQLIARKLLTKEDIESAFERSEEILIEKGYKSKD